MEDTRTYSFAEVLIAPEHIICSVQLHPFSLGHWIILENYGSPLLSTEIYPSLSSDDPDENYRHCIRHLLLFILVCGNDYQNNVRLINDIDFFNETKEVFERALTDYIKNTKYWNIFVEITKIREYLDYYMNSMPVFVETGPASPPSGIDWKNNLYCILKNEYGYSEEHIMNMSMRRIYAEWTTYAAKQGAIKVKPRQEVEAEKAAAEYVEKIKSGEIKMPEFPIQSKETIPCQ